MDARSTEQVFDLFVSRQLDEAISFYYDEPKIDIDGTTYVIKKESTHDGIKLYLRLPQSNQVKMIFSWDPFLEGWMQELLATNLASTEHTTNRVQAPSPALNRVQHPVPSTNPPPGGYSSISFQQMAPSSNPLPGAYLSMPSQQAAYPSNRQPTAYPWTIQPTVQLSNPMPVAYPSNQFQPLYSLSPLQQIAYPANLQPIAYSANRFQPIAYSLNPLQQAVFPTQSAQPQIKIIARNNFFDDPITNEYFYQLWSAMETDEATAIKLLSDFNKYEIDVNRFFNNTNLLMHAIKCIKPHTTEIPPIIVILVEKLSVQVDKRLERQYAPLDHAILRNHYNLVDYLLKRGAPIDRRHYNGKSALYLAIDVGNPDIIQLLIKHGANIDLPGNAGVNDQSPIEYAESKERHAIAKYLRDELKIIQDKTVTGDDHIPCDAFNKRMIELISNKQVVGAIQLLKQPRHFKWNIDEFHSMPSSLEPKETKTLAMYAAEVGLTEVVRALKEAGANLHLENSNGKNILHCAAANGNPDLVQLLLDHGVNCLRASLGHKFLPLHVAAKKGNFKAVELLANHAPETILLLNRLDLSAIDLAKSSEMKSFLQKKVEEHYAPDFITRSTRSSAKKQAKSTADSSTSTATISQLLQNSNTSLVPVELGNKRKANDVIHPPKKPFRSEEKNSVKIKPDPFPATIEDDAHMNLMEVDTGSSSRTTTTTTTTTTTPTHHEPISTTPATGQDALHKKRKTRSITVFNLKDQLDVIKTLRGNSKAKFNCVHIAQDILRYHLTGIKPTEQSITRPSTTKDFFAVPKYSAVKTESGAYAAITHSRVTHANATYPVIVQPEVCEVPGCDLISILIPEESKEEDSKELENILLKAKQNNTPVLMQYNTKYSIYGDPKGDGNWQTTEIDAKKAECLNDLRFIQGTLKRENPLLTPTLIKTLTSGHANLFQRVNVDAPPANRFKLDDINQSHADFRKINQSLMEEASRFPDGIARGIINFGAAVKQKYTLAFMSDKNRPDQDVIEFDCTEDKFIYRVIGLDDQLKTVRISWDELPGLPKNKHLIYKDLYNFQRNQDRYINIILAETAKRGHTEPVAPFNNTVAGHQLNVFANATNVWYLNGHGFDGSKSDEVNLKNAIFSALTDHFIFLETNDGTVTPYGNQVFYMLYEPLLDFDVEVNPIKTEPATDSAKDDKQMDVDTACTTASCSSQSTSSHLNPGLFGQNNRTSSTMSEQNEHTQTNTPQ